MITLEQDRRAVHGIYDVEHPQHVRHRPKTQLVFRFSEVHDNAHCAIEFQRTLRIPDDERDYPLPPGLGSFPLRHLDDYASGLTEDWLRRGGVIAPMHQAEAMWIKFASRHNFRLHQSYPFAVKIAAGKICAITGNAWVNGLNSDPQDYVVLPEQPWLDGYCIEKGVIRQFVAMPLGEGYTAEEQITGAAQHGGLQIAAYPMKAERYEELSVDPHKARLTPPFIRPLHFIPHAKRRSIGLAPGGRMKQEIFNDSYGPDAWDHQHVSRCFITIVNSAQWMAITGEPPPTEPPTAKQYTEMGLPWFDYYGGDADVISGAEKLKGLRSVNRIAIDKGDAPPENDTVVVNDVVRLCGRRSN